MEKVLSNLTFPCKFKDEGCQFVYNWDKLEEKIAHDRLCTYDTTRSCPLAIDPCTWNGKYDDMPRHIEECHSALIAPDSLTIDFDSFADGNDSKVWFIHKLSTYFQVVVQKNGVYVSIIVHFIGFNNATQCAYIVQFSKDRRSGETVANKCNKLSRSESGIKHGEYIGPIQERFAYVEIYEVTD